MASSTGPRRSRSASRSGTSKPMPACRILALARDSRWPIVAGATRNADATVAASKPSTTCSINGARTPG